MVDFDKTEIIPGRNLRARGRVLIVEPEAAIRDAFKQVLSDANFAVVTAESAVETLSHRLSSQTDVMVSRLEMEPLDGISLIRSIRMAQAHMPCILTSRNPSPMARESAKDARVQRILNLPTDGGKLVQAVTEALYLGTLVKARHEAIAHHPDPEFDPARKKSRLSLHMSPIVVTGTGRPFAMEAKLSATQLRFSPNAIAAELRQLVVAEMAKLGPDLKVIVPVTVSDVALEIIHKSNLANYSDRIIVALQADPELDAQARVAASLGVINRYGFQVMLDGLGGNIEMFLKFARLRPRYLRIDIGIFRLAEPTEERTLTALREYCRSVSMKMVADNVNSKADAVTAQDYAIDLMQGEYVGL